MPLTSDHELAFYVTKILIYKALFINLYEYFGCYSMLCVTVLCIFVMTCSTDGILNDLTVQRSVDFVCVRLLEVRETQKQF